MDSNDDYSSSTSSDDLFLQRPSKMFRPLSDSKESLWSSSSDIKDSTVRQHQIESDSETEVEEDEDNKDNILKEFDPNWRIPSGNKTNITFSDSSSINACQSEIYACTEPHDFYFRFVTDEIFEIIAKQTNVYATQKKSELQSHRLDQWHETNVNEIKRFFGLILWMGLVQLPRIELYWSKHEGYSQTLPRTIMSKKRFEFLLRFLHFSNNEENDSKNKLFKVASIIDHLNNNFKKYFKPDKILCVDEFLVPLQGDRVFRQYIKQKHHRYGIKILKLCSGPGYTYSCRIYADKVENTNEISENKSTEIIMALCNDILGKGHIICTNNWFTSVDLAEKLLHMKTHLLGTLQKNRCGNPQKVVDKKLKRGDVIALENNNGVVVLKWKDRKNVLMLSTQHSTEMTTVQNRNGIKEIPKMVSDYNLGKSFVDLPDQMIAYNSPLRKSVKWYKKVVIELLLNTCIVNSIILYKQVTRNNMEIPDFRMQLAMHLIKSSDNENISEINPAQIKSYHELTKVSGSTRNIRRYCKECYKTKSKIVGRVTARECTKKVSTYCSGCVGSPFLCLECFNTIHRNRQ